ncbi:MAG TPA: protein kinase [Pseudomonadota bacterium]|nr:protein kinase [Pseudomonadota bacterium]HRI49611.1 protein kinase [Pseudomonadota bacterium]
MSGEVVGSKIQSYRIIRQIGRGGMGNVYEARHEQIERRAAIKVLHPEYARDAEMAQRFFNEARAANVVGHPGLVSIYELGTLDNGAAYIIMEYLEGDSLRQRIRRPGGCQEVEALRIARQIAGALQAVHAKGIIHRDLKPDNIILVADSEVSGGERAKVLDFGIAKLLHGSESGRGLTNTGAVVGTPAYMAPEQCGMRMPVSDRTDVYALGIMLFEMLAGKPPFYGEGPTALIGQHLFVDPPPLPPSVSPDAAALVLRMLAKGPADRPSMVEVATALSSLGDFSRISRLDLAMPIASLLPKPSGGVPAAAPAAQSSGGMSAIALAVQSSSAEPNISLAAQSSGGAPSVSPAAQSSGTIPAVGITTIGQSTGERVEVAPRSPRWSPPVVAAIAALLLFSTSGTLWILLGQKSAQPSSARPPVEAAQAPPLARPVLAAASPAPAIAAMAASSDVSRLDPTPAPQPTLQPAPVQPAPIQPVAVQPTPVQPAPVQPTPVQPVTAQPMPAALPAVPIGPQSPGPQPPAPATLPAAGPDPLSAASCRTLFARKRYIDAIAACNAALASNPNQAAVRLTLRSAIARLATVKRPRPAAAPSAAPPPPARVEPSVVPAPPVKEHYEKVQPID